MADSGIVLDTMEARTLDIRVMIENSAEGFSYGDMTSVDFEPEYIATTNETAFYRWRGSRKGTGN